MLDVAGRYVVPGFIDAHVHGDLMLLADPIHLPALRQGVTTYLIGQDGSSFAPASPATLDYMRRYTAGFNGNPPGLSYDWRTVGEYLACFDRRVAINVAYLIPNGNVRMEVMGLDPRPATRRRAAPMQKLVRQGMDAGAIGLSTGLDYIPSLYADAREIAALCEPIVADNGVYVTHMRGYGTRAPVGMREVYEIVRASGVPAHISHYHGPADILLPLIDEGRALGFDLTYRHVSLHGRQHDPGHGGPAGLGAGGGDRGHRRTAARSWYSLAAQRRVVFWNDPTTLSTRSRSRWSPIQTGRGRKD